MVFLLGTLYPLITVAAGLGTVSIGAPYFNAIAKPWLLPLWAGLAIVPWLRWYQAVPHRRWYVPMLSWGACAAVLSPLLIWLADEPLRGWAVLGLAGILWVWSNTVAGEYARKQRHSSRQWGMLV